MGASAAQKRRLSAALAAGLPLGIQDDNVLVHGYYGDPNQVLSAGRKLRASIVRMIVPQEDVETAPGQFDWTKIDTAVNSARAAGYRVHMTLGNGRKAGAGGPTPAGYARFTQEAAARYRGKVADYGIFNEPDWAGISPKDYRQLYVAGRRAIKSQAPHARVYFGELTGASPLKYTADVLRQGHLKTEGFAWHPYQWTRPPESAAGRPDSVGIGKIGALSRFLQQHRRELSTAHGRVPSMAATEFGYRTRGEYGISDKQAAAWWPRALRQAAKGGLSELIAYQMNPDDRPNADAGGGAMPWDSSLLDSAGNPRLSFLALRRARRG